MFGLSWGELMVVGIVALIVIGPKDLPGLFRTMGEFTGKARRMAREFSRAMEAAADEAGVSDIQKTLNAAVNPKKFGVDKIREATNMSKAGPETAKLSEERQAAKDKILAATARAAEKRTAQEASHAAADQTETAQATDDTAVRASTQSAKARNDGDPE